MSNVSLLNAVNLWTASALTVEHAACDLDRTVVFTMQSR